MMKDKKILFVIPARGGSKGLPGKNIRPMNGKPLINYTVETALQMKNFCDARVIVSTDSKEIADTAKSAGAEIPFMRPDELAQDTSTSMDVILHALNFFESKGEKFDLLCMLEATSPQRSADDLKNAFELLFSTKDAESIVGVCRSESGHPAFLAKINNQKLIILRILCIMNRH